MTKIKPPNQRERPHFVTSEKEKDTPPPSPQPEKSEFSSLEVETVYHVTNILVPLRPGRNKHSKSLLQEFPFMQTNGNYRFAYNEQFLRPNQLGGKEIRK